MKVNRTLMPGPVMNSYSSANSNSCFGVSEDSIPQTSRASGTPLDRMVKIDLEAEPITPYHGKMSTENAKAWHTALVSTAGEVNQRYGELKAFGASADFYLEDLSQSLNFEADALSHARTSKLRFAGGSLGLGAVAGGTLAALGHPIIGGIVGTVGVIVAGFMASDAADLKKVSQSTRVASGLVQDWAQIDSKAHGTYSPSSEPPSV